MKPLHEFPGARRRVLFLLGTLGIAAPGLRALPRQDDPGEENPPPQDAQQDQEEDLPLLPGLGASAPDTPLEVHGSLGLSYRYRTADGGGESDGLGVLSLDVGNPDRDRFTAHFLGRGSVEGNDQPEFFDILDTFTSNWNGRIYDAYLEVHRLGAVQSLRLGRQSFEETPVFAAVDGASLVSEELTPVRLQLGAYGGVPTHLYESSPHGDWTAGAFSQIRPLDGTRLRLDWMHITDESTLGTENNDLFGAALWQQLGSVTLLQARTTFLDNGPRHWDASLRTALNESRTTFQLRYYELLKTQKFLATEFDPYFQAAFDYLPYRQVDFVAGQVFKEDYWIDGGVQLRFLRDRGDDNTFNHEFQRYYLTPTVDNLLVKDLRLSVTGELWASDGEDFSTYGGELEKDFEGVLSAAVGSYYSLYKFEFFGGREKDHVRTFFGRLRHDFGSIRAELDYEYEKDSFDRYQTIRVSATWTF